MPQGIIIKGVGGFYEVYEPTQARLVTCKARGLFRKDGIVPYAGDHVIFAEGGTEGSITDILERKNCLVRPPVANVDQLAIVISATTPEPDRLLVNRMLAEAEHMEIRPILILNKADLDVEGTRLAEMTRIFRNTGYAVLGVSAKTREGADAVEAAFKGCITALAGQSGVGKSTLLNAIYEDAQMETGALSEKVQRGKHTTRHVQLIHLAGDGYVCDTPGFSHFENVRLSHDTLEQCFPEFREGLGKCRFNGCSHLAEPECEIKSMLAQGLISAERYEDYSLLYRELLDDYQNRYRKR